MRIENPNPSKWYEIPGFDGKLRINLKGEVQSSNSKKGKWKNRKSVHHRNKIGYQLYIKVEKECGRYETKGKWRTMESLLYETFIGEIPEGYAVNHIDDSYDLKDLVLVRIGDINDGYARKYGVPIVKIDPSTGKIVERYKSYGEALKTNLLDDNSIRRYARAEAKNTIIAPNGWCYAEDSPEMIEKVLNRLKEERGENEHTRK